MAKIEAKEQVLQAKYEELSAKLELQAMQNAQPLPGAMPDGAQPASAIDPNQPAAPPQ